MTYRSELSRAMEFLAQDARTIFLGQSVSYPGHAIYGTLEKVPPGKRLELPVFEDFQMGLSTGLALEGWIPVTCYPRFDFLLLAANQLVNHLDKMRHMSAGAMRPRVIIRTAIGSKVPLDGGVQHTQDYTEAFRRMLTEVEVVVLAEATEIFPAFERALTREDSRSTLLIEHGDFYHQK
jgi:pyruvate/2-oxoglutarate/acetoin dehydrogenase E1 component